MRMTKENMNNRRSNLPKENDPTQEIMIKQSTKDKKQEEMINQLNKQLLEESQTHEQL